MINFKLKNAFLTILYSLMFITGYFLFLNYYFEYIGYTIVDDVSIFSLFISAAISLIPIFFYRDVENISSFIAIFIFLMLYIPTVFTFPLALEQYEIETPIVFIQLIFMIGMIILFLADRVPIKSFSFRKKNNLFPFIFTITIISILYMLFNYSSNLSFSGYDDVYEHRFANIELGKDLFTRYLSSWLSNFMIPICLSYGLISKKKYFITGTLGCLVIYMSTANKGVMLFPFFTFGLYYFLSKGYKEYSVLALTLIFFMAISLCFDFNVASSLLWMRTIGNGGHIIMHYYFFFFDHPNTYYAHINIINTITGLYSYGEYGVGQVVGSHFWSANMNANANFWATDGIAAIGLFGVLLSSVFLFLILVLFNIVTNERNKIFTILCFIPYLHQLLNTSLFSSLWTGGGILMMIFFLFVNNMHINEVKS